MNGKSNQIRNERPQVKNRNDFQISGEPAINPADILKGLKGFSGGLLYRYHKDNFLITEGVDFIVTKCKADWLVLNCYAQANELLEHSYFIRIELVMDGASAVLIYTDGNENILCIQQHDHTDFPLEGLVLYFTNNTFLLPCEY